MEAYIAGDYNSGDWYMSGTKELFKTALSDCKRVGDHMERWAGQIEIMMASSELP